MFNFEDDPLKISVNPISHFFKYNFNKLKKCLLPDEMWPTF